MRRNQQEVERKHPYGYEVRVRNIRDAEDMDLNGREGTLVRKWDFGFADRRYVFGEVGIVIHDGRRPPIKANLRANEYEVIWDES